MLLLTILLFVLPLKGHSQCTDDWTRPINLGSDFTLFTASNPWATDDSGNVFLGSNFSATVSTGSFTANTTGTGIDKDFLLAKFSTSGSPQWLKQWPNKPNSLLLGMAENANGQLISLSWVGDTLAQVGNQSLNFHGNRGLFLTVFGKDGEVEKLLKVGESNKDTGLFQSNGYVTTDAQGTIYVGGIYYGKVTIGGQQFNSGAIDTSKLFILALNNDGSTKWVATDAGSEFIFITGLTRTVNEGIIVSGYFYGSTKFSGVELQNQSLVGAPDAFVASYAKDGSFNWVRHVKGNAGESVNGIVSDADGNIYATGTFGGSLMVGKFTADRDYIYGSFILKLSADGTPVWIKTASGKEYNAMYASVTTNNKIVLAGSFGDSTIIDGRTLTMKGTPDGNRSNGFFGIMDTSGTIIRMHLIESSSNAEAMGTLKAPEADKVYIMVKYADEISFRGETLSEPGNHILIKKVCLDSFTAPSAIAETAAEKAINLYPNPASSVVHIVNAAPGEYQLQISDMLGRNVLSRQLTCSGNETLDVSGLEQGWYVISLSGKNGSRLYRYRLMKK